MAILAGCDLNSVIQQSKCFDCLSTTEKDALQVFFLAQALKAFGGSDFTNKTTLNSTVACVACLPDFRLESVRTSVYQKLASAAGAASIDLPIGQLRAKVNCSPCGDGKLNRAAEIFLLCQLALIGR